MQRQGEKMIRVLLVDDKTQQVEALKRKLFVNDMDVTLVSRAADALSLFGKGRFDVAVLDIRLPDANGVDLLERLKHGEPTREIIIYTGNATVDSAVECMKRGAYDYLTKSCEIEKLIEIIRKAAQERLKKEGYALHEHSRTNHPADNLVGESDGMKKVRGLIELVAPSITPVLILGETGTGKELVARAIHVQSLRRQAPLVVVNASTLQENILESELFGYKKGAFTGAFSDKTGLLEAADKGTCFIDEVGDMGLSIQSKVLRVVESGTFIKLGDTRETKVDVRFLFATNNDLASSVEYGSFRKDLFYRINAFTLNLPLLRERGEDVALLAHYFVKIFSRGKKCLSKKALALLAAYDWPGNVRELSNVIQRSVLVSGADNTIVPDDLPENIIHAVVLEPNRRRSASIEETNLAKRQVAHVAKVMDFTEGNKSKAARLLGISRSRLYRQLALQSA